MSACSARAGTPTARAPICATQPVYNSGAVRCRRHAGRADHPQHRQSVPDARRSAPIDPEFDQQQSVQRPESRSCRRPGLFLPEPRQYRSVYRPGVVRDRALSRRCAASTATSIVAAASMSWELVGNYGRAKSQGREPVLVAAEFPECGERAWPDASGKIVCAPRRGQRAGRRP